MEVIGGSSDHDDGVDGLDRGIFSRIVVNYDKTLDNGLQVSGDISYLLNTRYNFAPDVLSLSVGGGFGTVTVGAAAAAACATMPRVIAMVPGGVNATWYTLFSGVSDLLPGGNVTFSESNYCGTSESVSYSTPSMGGLSAMVTFAPNMGSTQAQGLKDADADESAEDYFAVAGKFSGDMGGIGIDIGASFQNAKDDRIESVSVAGILSMGGASIGLSWYDNGDASAMDLDTDLSITTNRSGTEGFNIGASYQLGAIKPGVTFSSMELEVKGDGGSVKSKGTAVAVGASYAVGGGLSVFAEYMRLDGAFAVTLDEGAAAIVGVPAGTESLSGDETILMTGANSQFLTRSYINAVRLSVTGRRSCVLIRSTCRGLSTITLPKKRRRPEGRRQMSQ